MNLNFYFVVDSPTTMGERKPPRLVEMFHRPQYVPRSLAANHLVSSMAHAGAPMPCTQQHQHQESDTGMQHEHVGSLVAMLEHIFGPHTTAAPDRKTRRCTLHPSGAASLKVLLQAECI